MISQTSSCPQQQSDRLLGKFCREAVTPTIKINDKVTKDPKLIAHSLSTYFLTVIEIMNNDITTLTTEDVTKYLPEAIHKTFPNIKLMPTTANEIKKYNSFKSKNLWLW
jgi:hypothetical protein